MLGVWAEDAAMSRVVLPQPFGPAMTVTGAWKSMVKSWKGPALMMRSFPTEVRGLYIFRLLLVIDYLGRCGEMEVDEWIIGGSV